MAAKIRTMTTLIAIAPIIDPNSIHAYREFPHRHAPLRALVADDAAHDRAVPGVRQARATGSGTGACTGRPSGTPSRAAPTHPCRWAAQACGSLPRFKRIAVAGSWDAAHQFLLDNRSHGGLPGYEVLTPLQLADGRVLLVDRGWVAFTGSRARLPRHRPRGSRAGVTHRPAGQSAGRRPGAGPRGPDRRCSRGPRSPAFPTFAELAAALGHPVRALDAAARSGERRRLCAGLAAPGPAAAAPFFLCHPVVGIRRDAR